MKQRRGAVILWLLGVAAAAVIVATAHYITDLSAFLPANPTPAQRLLVDQLRDGPASRLILAAIENGAPPARAHVAMRMAERLRGDPQFSSVEDGEPRLAEATQAFVFQNRYLLSDAVEADRFSAEGLESAIRHTIENLATSEGLMLKALVPRDPTGEMLNLADEFAQREGPHTDDGVWVSADHSRTVLVAQTTAAGSDTDGQERAISAIQAAFAAAAAAAGSGSGVDLKLRLSGPGVFAVAARTKIKTAATRLSIVSSLMVVGVLLVVYRSVPALVLGLLPVATGAVAGIAAVAVGFGAVHGVTLGFGITLIGEAVDYTIYFFMQSQQNPGGGTGGAPAAVGVWQRQLWPTVRLGMLTSVCGFASLLPSGFPGLAQLGLYSITGLLAAASVTRFVLPELIPRRFEIRDLAPVGRWIERRHRALRSRGPLVITLAALMIGALALGVLKQHQATLWNRDLADLSPVPPKDLRYDAMLRADLGAANVLDVVVIRGASLEAVLEGAEQAAGRLERLVQEGVIGQFDSPARYLPSHATQRRRREALPPRQTLETNLRRAAGPFNLQERALAPFLEDVEAARTGPLLTPQSLRGTSLAVGFDALVLHEADRWSAMLPLHAPAGGGEAGPSIDLARVQRALGAIPAEALVLDLKQETDALYASYLHEAIRLSEAGFALIAVLLLFALRSLRRVAGVLAPLVLAVLTVSAALALAGVRLNILHLVGMLLIVAVGSNYALFFDEARSREVLAPLTLASLALANLCTVIGFGLLSFSRVPVLEALGETVAPGALLALVFSAAMTAGAAPPQTADA
jgi:predicted exporter